jgi:hypothetical protein
MTVKPHKSEIFAKYEGALFIPKIPKILKSTTVEWPDNFWIITACDPYSAGDRTRDNRTMKQLRQELAAKSVGRIGSLGFLPIGSTGRHRSQWVV